MKIRSKHFVRPIIGKTRAVMIACLIGAGVSFGVTAQTITDLQRGFARPPDDARVMMRWWWFGPAVTKAELEREMRLMKEGGIGGFEVQAVYPLTLDDSEKGIKNFPFLSDEHIDALKFVSAKARELGLRMDLTIGSGWPFGGPQGAIDQASGMLRSERRELEADARGVPVPDISAGEKRAAVVAVRPQGHSIDADS